LRRKPARADVKCAHPVLPRSGLACLLQDCPDFPISATQQIRKSHVLLCIFGQIRHLFIDIDIVSIRAKAGVIVDHDTRCHFPDHADSTDSKMPIIGCFPDE
jgi:hypothetical protein